MAIQRHRLKNGRLFPSASCELSPEVDCSAGRELALAVDWDASHSAREGKRATVARFKPQAAQNGCCPAVSPHPGHTRFPPSTVQA